MTLAGATVNVPAGATATAAGANQFTSGTLGGVGTFGVTGTLTWTGGSMSDAGTTRVTGRLVSEGATTVFLASGRLLENAGTVELRSTRTISGSGTQSVLHNTGTVVKSAGTGATTISTGVENDGGLSSTAGTIELTGGDGPGSSSGSFAGDVQLKSQTFDLADGATFAGGVQIAGATVDVAAGATATAAGANAFASGTLGGLGTFAVSGTLTWTGGSMSDAGTTRVTGRLVSDGTTTVFLASGRVVENEGTFELRSDKTISGSGTQAVLHNTGTLVKSAGAGTATISTGVENDGVLRSDSGALALSGGDAAGSSSGSFAGDVRLTSQTFDLAGGASLAGGVRIAGASVDVAPNATATASGANTLASGEIGGLGTFAVTGTLTWTGGSMSDTGTTRIAAGGTLARDGTTNVFLAAGRALENDGTVDLRGDSPISGSGTPGRVHNSGTLRKSAGAGSARIGVPLTNDGRVTSLSGRLEIEGGSGDGVVHGGDFEGASDSAPVVFRAGVGRLAAGAELDGFIEIAGGTVRVMDGVAIESRLTLASGELGGPGDLNVTGTLRWTGGTFSGPGTALVAAGAQLDVGGSGCSVDLRDGRLIDNRGTLRVTGGVRVSTFGTPRSVIENSATLRVDDSAPGTCTNTGFSGNALIHNTGTIEKLGGDGTAAIGDTLDNDGQLVVTRGALSLASTSAVTHAGAFRGTGGPVTFANGTFDLGAGATISGSVGIEFAGVNLPDGLTLTIDAEDALRMRGGSLDGGDLDVRGGFAWEGGRRGGAGSTTIEPGAAVTVGVSETGGFATASLASGHTLVNRGVVEVRRTTWDIADGASLINAGTLRFTGGARVTGDDFGSGGGFGSLLHNTGLLLKTGTDGAALDVPVDNDGTVEVQAGVLQFERLLNYSGDGSLTGGSWIVRSPGQLWLPGSLRTNAARVVLDGPGAGLRYEGDFQTPLRDALDRFARNAAGGRLEITGGDEVTVLGSIQNLGVLRIGAGSKLTVGGFQQSGTSAVLRPALAGGTSFGRLVTSGIATLGGRLDVERTGGFVPAAGQEFAVVSAGSVSGTFAAVTGTDLGGGLSLEPRYEAPGVKLRVRAPEPASSAPSPAVSAAPSALAVRIDDRALSVASSGWLRTRTSTVAHRRGATLVKRALTARGVAVVARTCSTCGSLEVRFGGVRKLVSLRSTSPARRTITVAEFTAPRTGTMRLSTRSARRVAIDALVVIS